MYSLSYPPLESLTKVENRLREDVLYEIGEVRDIRQFTLPKNGYSTNELRSFQRNISAQCRVCPILTSRVWSGGEFLSNRHGFTLEGR